MLRHDNLWHGFIGRTRHCDTTNEEMRLLMYAMAMGAPLQMQTTMTRHLELHDVVPDFARKTPPKTSIMMPIRSIHLP